MAPFRPKNINKRAYPGNANVVGPTRQATCNQSTTKCFSSTNTCSACSVQNVLGCRWTYCACPCCNICCCCDCITCTRTVPSGMWNISEVYEARTRDAWGDTTSTTGAEVCVCNANYGVTCVGVTSQTDCKGFFYCCSGAGSCKWFVAPACTQVNRTWNCRNDAVTVANSCMGSCGWFVGNTNQLSNALGPCRTYWDSISPCYWSSQLTGYDPSKGYFTFGIFRAGSFGAMPITNACPVRSIRCTAS